MKGLFIPEITAEMFRNGCLESIEALMAEGEICDIDYEPEPRWIPVTERLPMINTIALITTSKGIVIQVMYFGENMNGHKVWRSFGGEYVYWDEEVVAWMPLPEPYERSEDAEID